MSASFEQGNSRWHNSRSRCTQSLRSVQPLDRSVVGWLVGSRIGSFGRSQTVTIVAKPSFKTLMICATHRAAWRRPSVCQHASTASISKRCIHGRCVSCICSIARAQLVLPGFLALTQRSPCAASGVAAIKDAEVAISIAEFTGAVSSLPPLTPPPPISPPRPP